MIRLVPRSLLGQMLLLMAAALLVAQLINLAFILNEQQKLNLAQNEGPAITRFVEGARHVVALPPSIRPDFIRGRGGPARAYSLDGESLVARSGLERDSELEARLAAAIAEARVPLAEPRVATLAVPPPPGPGRHHFHGRRLVLVSARLPDGAWLNARLPIPPRDPWLIHRLLLATLTLFVLVLAAVWWTARRLARPLRELTKAARSFDGRLEVAPVEPSGPADVAGAIDAFNAMNRRVVTLLDEKDRMLGAIGHDLRTPLASLRIRAENMAPAEEREKLAATIEEMAATLEDILVLARTGRAREPVRSVDVAALADSVVEEFRSLGSSASFAESERAVLDVQPNLLRRALRNLIENAVTHGGGASVAVVERPERIEIVVDDEGPGIPADRIAEMLEPFRRMEESRSRETGGAGLGLAIACAVAEAHGGRLVLERRPEGGMGARLILPRPDQATARQRP